MMREDLPKFEDFKFLKMSLRLNMNFKTLKLVHTYYHFGIFINDILFFSNE
jgi:hypothetical protein